MDSKGLEVYEPLLQNLIAQIQQEPGKAKEHIEKCVEELAQITKGYSKDWVVAMIHELYQHDTDSLQKDLRKFMAIPEQQSVPVFPVERFSCLQNLLIAVSPLFDSDFSQIIEFSSNERRIVNDDKRHHEKAPVNVCIGASANARFKE